MNLPIKPNSIMRFVLGAIGAFGIALAAQAASFDCSKAQSKVEHIICDDPEISKLDEELARSYKAALKDNAQAEAITQAQKQWMKERNGCQDAACVKRIYVQRNTLLIGMAPISDKEFERDKYVVSSGKGNALCEQMLKRMNEELRLHPHGPVCAYDALKAIPGVTFPDWNKLPLKENELTYKRFLLSKMVYPNYYPEIFGGSGKKAGEFNMPTMGQYSGTDYLHPKAKPGVPIDREFLNDIFDLAVKRGNELYLWKGVFSPPNETDVLLVEMSRFHLAYPQEGCPNFRLSRFSADLLTPKPWLQTNEQQNPKWRLGYNSIHFIFDGQFFQLAEQLSEAPQLSNGFILGTIQKFRQCEISGNFYFPPSPDEN